MFRVGRGVLFSALAAMLVCACSASDFKQPVTAFQTATKKAAGSFDDQRKALEKLRFDTDVTAALSGGRIAPQGDDCSPRAARCRLHLRAKGGEDKIFGEEAYARLAALMDGVGDYADNLAAIVNADSTTAITQAVETTKTNLLSLAGSGDALAAQLKQAPLNLQKKLTPFATPVAQAVEFGLGKYLEARKLAALRDATTSMDAIFPDLTGIFGLLAERGQQLTRDALRNDLRKAAAEYERNGKSRPKIEAYLSAAQALDGALQTDPRGLFNALRDAHAALAAGLRGDNPSFEMLATMIQRVSDEAVKLTEIVKSFRKKREA